MFMCITRMSVTHVDYFASVAGCVSQLTNAAVCRRRALLFDEEEKRQRALVGRLQKMEVNYEGAPENCTLIMNQHLSTPHDCAKRESESLGRRGAR